MPAGLHEQSQNEHRATPRRERSERPKVRGLREHMLDVHKTLRAQRKMNIGLEMSKVKNKVLL